MYKIMVLLSAYKGAGWLKEQLDSIRCQKGVDVRLIVRDDGSPDDNATVTLLHGYKASHPDFDMRIIEGCNVGYVESFSRLLTEALGYTDIDFFAFSDQDDVWLEDKLLVAAERLGAYVGDDSPVMYCSNTLLVDKDLNKLRKAWCSDEVEISKARSLVQSFATGCTMVFNHAAVEQYNSRYNSEVRVHDYFMYLICVFLGHVVYDDNPHILYRQHGSNQIGKPGSLKRWKKRLSLNWDKSRFYENQAKCFLSSFEDVLSVEDMLLLRTIANYRMNIGSRIRLVFDKRFSRYGLEENLIQKIKIMRGLL